MAGLDPGLDPAIVRFSGKPMRKIKEIELRTDSRRRSGTLERR
jgi:hypothetical protein